jgi:hypothetical protein
VRSRGELIRIAKAPKYLKISVRHGLVMEEGERNTKLKGLDREAIE